MSTVFDYSDYLDFIRVEVPQHLFKRRRPTLDNWAKRLGYRSPRLISMVLAGKRYPSLEMLCRLSRTLRLSEGERQYLEMLVKLKKNSTNRQEVETIKRELDQINPRNFQRASIDSAAFHFIADWYHLVIKQLIDTPAFQEDWRWVQGRLWVKLKPKQILDSFRTMLQLGVLGRSSGRLVVVRNEVSTGNDIPDKAIQSHHQQMLERASRAVEEQEVREREITSLTLAFDPGRINEAKEVIRRFKATFNQRFHCSEANSVYQLNLQFFSHTKEPE
jgi:uncharacterized protein (TIGR02147 family)